MGVWVLGFRVLGLQRFRGLWLCFRACGVVARVVLTFGIRGVRHTRSRVQPSYAVEDKA